MRIISLKEKKKESDTRDDWKCLHLECTPVIKGLDIIVYLWTNAPIFVFIVYEVSFKIKDKALDHVRIYI